MGGREVCYVCLCWQSRKVWRYISKRMNDGAGPRGLWTIDGYGRPSDIHDTWKHGCGQTVHLVCMAYLGTGKWNYWRCVNMDLLKGVSHAVMPLRCDPFVCETVLTPKSVLERLWVCHSTNLPQTDHSEFWMLFLWLQSSKAGTVWLPACARESIVEKVFTCSLSRLRHQCVQQLFFQGWFKGIHSDN